MRRATRHGAALALLAALSGCMSAMPDSPAEPAPSGAAAGACPVIGDGVWEAWLNAMPGPGASGPTLVISGTVDMPSPGYALKLIEGPADRMMPPSQRFRLEAVRRSGMAAQVVTSTQVSYREKATYSAYRSILILCGDRALATITDIRTVS